jgi:sugar O-acyltransferase (sialic acid O-acetyltransferase NeuD family)
LTGDERGHVRSLAIIGAGGHGCDVIDIADAAGLYADIQLFADWVSDDERLVQRELVRPRPLADLDPARWEVVIAIGDPVGRRAMARRLAPLALRYAVLIHPNTTIGRKVEIGEGVVIHAGARVSGGARLGSHAYLSHNVSVGHDAQVGAFGTVLPLGVVSGNAVLHDAVLVGTSAVVLEGRTVGEASVVGAGALVTKDVPSDVTVTGVPASRQGPRGEGPFGR